MTLRGLEHIQIAIPAGGEAEARVFYGGMLGLAEIPKPPALASRGGCWFRLPGVDLHLGVDPSFNPAGKAHPAFLVDELQALRARLEAAGVQVQIDRAVPGVRRFYCVDPFGNRLEFIQRGEGFQ